MVSVPEGAYVKPVNVEPPLIEFCVPLDQSRRLYGLLLTKLPPLISTFPVQRKRV